MIQIDELIKDAMHQKNRELLNVLKLIKAEFLKKQTEPNRASKELSEDEQFKVLMKMSAQRKDSIEQYEKGGRADLAENEKKELEVINSYLPKEASEEEIIAYTKEAADTFKSSKGDSYMLSMKDMKDIMAFVKAKYPTANGGLVSKAYKEYISN